MRIFDLLWMAIRNLKGRFMILPVAAIAISTFCLCFAGAVLVNVQQEKSLPCELKVVSNTSKISDSVLAEISGIPDVTAVTPVLQVPVSIEAGGYNAQLILTGIDAAFIDDAFAQGGVFPDSSVMPYIVLNKAACELLSDNASRDENTDKTDEHQIDWLSAVGIVRTSESAKPATSKIVGILSGDDEAQEPAAYISIVSAKALLQKDGQNADYMSAGIRIENVGCAAAVSKQITALGLGAINVNEDMDIKWDMELKEMTYLILIGVICLISALVFIVYRIKMLQLELKEALIAMRWIGIKEKELNLLSTVQSMIIALSGIVIGTIVIVFVPSFISPEIQGTIIFSLRVPFSIIVSWGVICLIAGIVPIHYGKLKRKS